MEGSSELGADTRSQLDRRFAFLGCGSIGRRHARNLFELGARDLVFYDPCPERAQALANHVGGRATATLSEIWATEPDVAFVTSPTSDHVPLALDAARHGCHLFIEKPLSDRVDAVCELAETILQRHLVALVGCNLRFHPGLRLLKRFVENGSIGRVTTLRAEYGQYLPDWHPGEDYRRGYSARRNLGGGVILDAIHEIDYARWILGAVCCVSCFSDRLGDLEIDTEDTASILLKFQSGALGEVHLDYLQRSYSRSCQIIGCEGTLQWDGVSGEVRLYRASETRWESHALPDEWNANSMYCLELRHFLDCLAGSAKPEQDICSGASSLEIALAAHRSARTGQAVTLPLSPDTFPS